MTDQNNAYLQKIEGEWEQLKGTMKSKMADARMWTDEQKTEWEREQRDFEGSLKEWRNHAADTGEEWKDKAEKAWRALKSKWNDTVEDIKN